MKASELLTELEVGAQATRTLLARVPEDKFGWRPHEKSMTLGELATHVAMLPGGIANMSNEPTFDVRNAKPRPAKETLEEVLLTHDTSFNVAREILSRLDDDSLASSWRMMNDDKVIMMMTRGGLLRTILFNHWYHHRGQLTVYLRLLNVPLPSLFGPTADENPFV